MVGKTICVDFDGVLSQYDGWKGVGVFGPPIIGVKEALHRFKSFGCIIIINTCRSEHSEIEKYMSFHKLPFDYINYNPKQHPEQSKEKIVADVYIDDKALHFLEWNENFVQYVLEFEPGYQLKNKAKSDKYSFEMAELFKRLLSTFISKNFAYGSDFFLKKYNKLDSYHAISRPWRRLERYLKGQLIFKEETLFEVCKDLAIYSLMVFIKHRLDESDTSKKIYRGTKQKMRKTYLYKARINKQSKNSG